MSEQQEPEPERIIVTVELPVGRWAGQLAKYAAAAAAGVLLAFAIALAVAA